MGEILKYLAISASEKSNANRSGPQGRKTDFTVQDIQSYLAMFIDMCGRRKTHMYSYLQEEDRIGLPTNRFEKLRANLTFSPKVLFELFNKGLASIVDVGGHGAIDEAMWEYKGQSPFVVTIKRKPKDTGIRCYLLCFPLTTSGLPVCFQALPDIRTPCFTGSELLEWATKVVPKKKLVSLTADSFFGSLPWLNSHKSFPYTLSLDPTDLPLVELFAYQLKHKEYRTYSNGELVISVWLDNKLMVTASSLVKPPITKSQERLHRGFDVSDATPSLSLEAVETLQELSGEDLKTLAKMCGKSQGYFTNFKV